MFTVIHFLSGCTKTDQAKVDFTIDLTQAQFSSLANFGGYVLYNGVLITRTGTGAYIAVSGYCTRGDGCALTYNVSIDRFVCPCDQSEFNEQGAVTTGPATLALTQYNTQLTNNLLRVYSS